MSKNAPIRPAVAPDIGAKLEELQRRRNRLDELDDAIGKQIALVEEVLAGLKLGVPLHLDAGRDWDDDALVIGFEKVGQAWRLVYIVKPKMAEDDPDTWSTTPISDLNRSMRARILREHLPLIFDEALAELQRAIADRERTLSSAAAVTEQVQAWLQKKADEEIPF